MRLQQQHWAPRTGWSLAPGASAIDADLVLVFGSPAALRDASWREEVTRAYPGATLTGCSTAGEILDTRVLDDGVTCTAIDLERSYIRVHATEVGSATDSAAAGRELARQLTAGDLRHVLVLSDGLHVNGSALVSGLTGGLPDGVTVTGGLSADGDRFEETLVLLDERLAPRLVVAVGFYGADLVIGCGSLGGWDPFGPERLITHSRDNVLFELDGRSALSLYQMYLGEHAAGLPATALFFPLSIRASTLERPVVRTVLAVDPQDGSMTFAGDVPQGAYAQLMRANFDRLIDGAAGAARTSHAPLTATDAQLALLISCVGRKLVLAQRIEEEVEAVRDVLGPAPILAGFYSYGELGAADGTVGCDLHNQTMTLTTIRENIV